MDPKTSQKILIVEDDNTLRSLYITILEGAGFSVDSAADGKIAYDLMHRGGYDLVLLDIMLPSMDGLEILEELNINQPAEPNKHIVILSNVGQDDAIAKAMSLGVEGYLIKSDYTPDKVIERVNSFLITPAPSSPDIS